MPPLLKLSLRLRSKGAITLVVLVGVFGFVGCGATSTYNNLVQSDEQLQGTGNRITVARREEELSADKVRSVLNTGLILRRSPEDTPFPSYFVLGWVEGPARLGTYRKGCPIHVAAANDDEKKVTWIISLPPL